MGTQGRQRGFSLIELLIVCAIIIVIVAIAIPNLLRSRMAAAQSAAVAAVRTINTASVTYNSSYGNGFPPSLSAIGNDGTTTVTCTNAELIDSVLASGIKGGYTFVFTPGTVVVNSSTSICTSDYGFSDGYLITAAPISVGVTGQISYCSDVSGVIRSNPNATVNPGPSPTCAATDNPMQ